MTGRWGSMGRDPGDSSAPLQWSAAMPSALGSEGMPVQTYMCVWDYEAYSRVGSLSMLATHMLPTSNSSPCPTRACHHSLALKRDMMWGALLNRLNIA